MSQSDEKGGERGIKSDSGDAKGGDRKVNMREASGALQRGAFSACCSSSA